jgi:hypothetical protein
LRRRTQPPSLAADVMQFSAVEKPSADPIATL